MLYKDDWAQAKERLAAWWDGEIIDRPAMQVLAPRILKGGSLRILFDESARGHWDFALNPSAPDRAIDKFERWCSKIYFGGEAYPNLWINLGAGILGAYLGAEVKFEANTVWFGAQWSSALSRGWDELYGLEFDENNIWWRHTRMITKRALERSKGRFLVGMTDLGGIADILASLRGPQNLLSDFYRKKQDVRVISQKITEIWHRCYDELDGIIRTEMEGSSAWMGIWSPRKWYPIQCDFAAMLSPRLFDELVLPFLREQCQRLDDPVYHLDGPGQLCHVESLLKIPELRGIQWVPGAREDSLGDHCGSRKWFPLYRKILSEGKNLVLALPPGYIRRVVKEFSPKRILFQTATISELAAKLLLKSAR